MTALDQHSQKEIPAAPRVDGIVKSSQRNRGRRPGDPVERFMAKIERLRDGCWRWKGQLDGYGAGSFWLDGRSVGAHRAGWALLGGEPIPKGFHLARLCGRSWCVAPDHMAPVARWELRDIISIGAVACVESGYERVRELEAALRARGLHKIAGVRRRFPIRPRDPERALAGTETRAGGRLRIRRSIGSSR
jgi:hypothetical protein